MLPLVYYWVFLIVWNGIVAEIKRWHDLNKSGMWGFIALVPFGNFYAIYKLGFCKGTDGDNQYGPSTKNPKQPQGNQMKNTKNNDEARQKQIKEVYGSERAYQQHQQYARRADDIEKERETYRKSRKWLPVHILLVCLFPRGVRGVIGVIILCLSLVVSLFRVLVHRKERVLVLIMLSDTPPSTCQIRRSVCDEHILSV